MQFGEYEKKLKAVNKCPPAPEIYNDIQYIWEAFLAVSNTRKQGRITFSEIESWLNINHIVNIERRQEVAHIIRILDLEYVKYFEEKGE